MDKFVIRNPKPKTIDPKPSPSKPKLKQTTIESLKGVVIVEDILRHKSILVLKTSSKEEILNSLRELGKKIPSRNVMLDTKIGRTVNKLCKNEDQEISQAAKRVYIKWRSHFEDHFSRPLIEVRCDLKTERLRTSGRKLLTDALQVETNHSLPDAIERQVFQEHRQLVNNNYKRTMRALVFLLKNQQNMRTKVLAGEITVKHLVKENKK
ncbi:hypothetical protein ACJMK2_042106 [Sinanodonta woodiana]|uniref:Transcription elongation factor A N-terminal and central domain-containing protein 2 n=1 Tax=Sinanodonta woodiana TaxID=1069815 RepID=A0ABD3W9I3_SINWO